MAHGTPLLLLRWSCHHILPPPAHPAHVTSFYIFISSLLPLLYIGYLAIHASNFIDMTFFHSVPLRKSGITRFPLTCIKSIPSSIPNPTLTHSRNHPTLDPISTDPCDLSYFSQWLPPPSTASMTATLVLNPIFQVSHLSFIPHTLMDYWLTLTFLSINLIR